VKTHVKKWLLTQTNISFQRKKEKLSHNLVTASVVAKPGWVTKEMSVKVFPNCHYTF